MEQRRSSVVQFVLWAQNAIMINGTSHVRGVETITRYDASTQKFIVSTPCESALKYWIGGTANHATHIVVFSQLEINGVNQGVHAFIAQIRDADANVCPNVRIADWVHKIDLNGWFDNLRIPRQNLLNSVASVSPYGQYLTDVKDPDQLELKAMCEAAQ
ncbi:acyl-coenzyme A oxidase 3, peroxisomal-like [Rutidosis leptorrhynchoides]|uniref:acyl-coenzyme A oxidase 3, peroxisomal-like n=1 Tax=Rutidosis leptorrhynchoides TaxID=125765 RepID=UPI003A98CE5A